MTGVSVSARAVALKAAFEALPPTRSATPVSVVRVSAAQWARSLDDAELDERIQALAALRAAVERDVSADGVRFARVLRPTTIKFAAAASDVCVRLDTLAAFYPDRRTAEATRDQRDAVAQHAISLVDAVRDGRLPPPTPTLDSLPRLGDTSPIDSLSEIFGVPTTDVSDHDGRFCDSRVLARFRLRLHELEARCDPVMRLVTNHPPSVFSSVARVRDLITSPSPFLTLQSAREVRELVVAGFSKDPERTVQVFAQGMGELEAEWSSFFRVRAALKRDQEALTERDHAIECLDAYKHMAEGICRRWTWTLLRISGLDGTAPTIGTLSEMVSGRLGQLGSRIDSALVPALRNSEAHDDVSFDDDTGLLVCGGITIEPETVRERFIDLDILTRGFELGQLAALADAPALAKSLVELGGDPSAGSAMALARQRFGHAGQHVRSFVRDRDRLDVVIDSLRPEACNPCFVALTQAAQILPAINRFVVSVTDREHPIIDLPSSVLHANWLVFEQAARSFPDGLPQVTFLPSLTWTRLSCEPIEAAVIAAAWLALNDAQHAILDAEASPGEVRRLPLRLQLVCAAASVTADQLPRGDYMEAPAYGWRSCTCPLGRTAFRASKPIGVGGPCGEYLGNPQRARANPSSYAYGRFRSTPTG